MNASNYGCSCQLQSDTILYYGCGKLAARFTYEPIAPFGVFIRHSLPIEYDYHRDDAMSHMKQISDSAAELFVSFDSHIEKVSREARNLFNSAVNRPEHLQIVLSELNRIASESDHVAKTLQEKIVSVIDNCKKNDDPTTNAALLRFPWFARRYVFNLATAWNEKLRYAGQAISAMKKIASAASRIDSGGLGPNVSANVGDPYHEELTEGMKKLRHLIDHYANVNVNDINQALPSFPGIGDELAEAEFDDDFDDPDTAIDFAEGVDADVLASRRRLVVKGASIPNEKSRTSDQRPSKALGTRRSVTDQPHLSHGISNDTSMLDQSLNSSTAQKATPGGAVKSAITRFFNRGGRDYEQYIVNLGMFSIGRPRLSPGVNGRVVPVLDEQLNTIIAYSLSSIEYSKQFKQFSRQEGALSDPDGSLIDRTKPAKPDLDAGIENYGSRDRPNDDGYTSQRNRNSSPLSHGTGKSTIPSPDDIRDQERRMLARNKSHIKHTFRDIDEKGLVTCKFVCTSYWATQFHAVRQVFLSPNATGNNLSSTKTEGEQQDSLFVQTGNDAEQSYIDSLSSAEPWAASGGKSGASFSRTSDGRFVIKCISRTELQMFLDCAPAYFEYLTKAFFHGL
jgi:Phosphatidylinositol-4-phosphate 5-Kinase